MAGDIHGLADVNRMNGLRAKVPFGLLKTQPPNNPAIWMATKRAVRNTVTNTTSNVLNYQFSNAPKTPMGYLRAVGSGAAVAPFGSIGSGRLGLATDTVMNGVANSAMQPRPKPVQGQDLLKDGVQSASNNVFPQLTHLRGW